MRAHSNTATFCRISSLRIVQFDQQEKRVMNQLGTMSALLVSGSLLMASAVMADPERQSMHGKMLDQSSRFCSSNHNCRSSANSLGRDERDDHDDNRPSYRYDDQDRRDRTRVELRISNDPYYDDYRRPFYNRPYRQGWGPSYGYRRFDRFDRFDRYDDRNRNVIIYQNRYDAAPESSRIIWNDDSTQNTTGSDQKVSGFDTSYCREYQKEVTIDGKTQQTFGTACRQPDGTWRIQN